MFDSIYVVGLPCTSFVCYRLTSLFGINWIPTNEMRGEKKMLGKNMYTQLVNMILILFYTPD